MTNSFVAYTLPSQGKRRGGPLYRTPTRAMNAQADLLEALLGTSNPDKRRQLIAGHPFSSAEARALVLHLFDVARGFIGVDPARMESIAGIARAVADKAGDPFLIATAQHSYADALRFQARNQEAARNFDEAAAIFNRLGHPEEAASTRVGWAWVMAAMGRHEEALQAVPAARLVLLKHGLTPRVGALHTTAGFIYDEHGRHREALRHFSSALRLYTSLGEQGVVGVARAHANRGRTLIRLGRSERAKNELELAREMFEAQGAKRDTAVVIQYIGEHQLSLGQYTTALKNFERARTMVRAVGLDRESMLLARYIADCYLLLGRPYDALEALDEVEEILRRTDVTQHRVALAARRVAALLTLGQREQALRNLSQIEAEIPQGAIQHKAWIATQTADVFLQDGQAAEAAIAARRGGHLARVAGLRSLRAEALVLEASAVLALDSVSIARQLVQRARRLARGAGGPYLSRRIFEVQGLIAERQGQARRARKHYEAAIEKLELEQSGVIFDFRDSFFANRGLAYERLAVLQAQAGLAEEAFRTVERAKSRALAGVMAGAIQLRPRRSPEARSLTKQLAVARQEYSVIASENRPDGQQDIPASNQRRLEEIEGEIATLMQRLQITSAPEGVEDLYGQAMFSGPSCLPNDTALIEFFFAGQDVLRFVVTSSGVRADLCPGVVSECERLLRAFKLNLDEAERASAVEQDTLAKQAQVVLTRLNQRLLGGIGDLSVFRSVVFVPHAFLHYLPFHALFDGEEYLIERVAVSYAPSATIYELCRRRRQSRSRGALVMSNSYGGRLPFTNDEAAGVASALGTHAYQEDEATRQVLQDKGGKASVIHIAAHGHFRPDAPMFSALELADGPLTSADVFGLRLRADLVSLSACETGRSMAGGGDELLGLVRAFFAAGAASLLVSQWRVEDRSTEALMQRFYEELNAGKSTADALRTAQMEFLGSGMPQKRPCHPFLWAAFQIIGDDRGLR